MLGGAKIINAAALDPLFPFGISNYDGHTCTCMVCTPDLVGAAEPLAGNLAIKWGTLGPYVPGFPYLDGDPIEHVYEMQEGPAGYVLRYRGGDVHLCQTCKQDACAERLDGAVELRGPDADPRAAEDPGIWNQPYWSARKPWH